jgi:hypothetical protein
MAHDKQLGREPYLTHQICQSPPAGSMKFVLLDIQDGNEGKSFGLVPPFTKHILSSGWEPSEGLATEILEENCSVPSQSSWDT